MPLSPESATPVVHVAYGLRYRSHLDWLPLRRCHDGDAGHDVEVTFGAVPAELGPGAVTTPRCDTEPGRLLFRTRTIADFLAEDGSRVRIQPKWEADDLRLCNLLFGAVTGGLLIQRDTLALHGCSVETPAGAVIFCGSSGAGKSTLASLLVERGFRALDDNIAALRIHEGRADVQPGLGYLRLTGDTLRLLRRASSGPGFPSPFELKFIDTLGPDRFCDEPRPLRQIFVLDRERPELEAAIPVAERVAALARFTFMARLVRGLGKLEGHFRRQLRVASSVPVAVLGSPPAVAIESWADMIADRLRRL